MDRFRYQVTPFTPINNLIKGKSLRRPFSSDLTKEEVMLCMKCGPVYRVFPGKTPIRVTGSNIDQLHIEASKAFKQKIETAPSNETTKDEYSPIQESVVTEEPKNDAPVEEEEKPFNTDAPANFIREHEEVVEAYTESQTEVTPVEDEIPTIEEKQEEVVEEVNEEDATTIPLAEVNVAPVQQQSYARPQNNNYNKKKKH